MTIREKIGATLCGIGMFIAWGTAGAIEHGTISFTRCAGQIAIALAFVLLGLVIGKIRIERGKENGINARTKARDKATI